MHTWGKVVVGVAAAVSTAALVPSPALAMPADAPVPVVQPAPPPTRARPPVACVVPAATRPTDLVTPDSCGREPRADDELRPSWCLRPVVFRGSAPLDVCATPARPHAPRGLVVPAG